MYDLLFNLLGALASELRKRPRLRRFLVIVSPIAAILLGLAYQIFTKTDGSPTDATRHAEVVLTPLIFISIITFVVSVASFTDIRWSAFARLEVDLDALRAEREKLKERLNHKEDAPTQHPADVLDTIRLNLNQLTEYYTINKGQARSSFRASMGAMITGFITILVGIWIFYTRPVNDWKIPALAGIGGLIAEFIAAAYFYIYNRSLTQLNYFFDKLTAMQDTMLAVKLSDNLPEERATAAKEHLIIMLMAPHRSSVPKSLSALPTPRKPRTPAIKKQATQATKSNDRAAEMDLEPHV